MPMDYRRAAAHTTPEPEPAPAGPPCPGTCNAGWRAAEKRLADRGTPNELQPRGGQPVWCPACVTAIRGTLTDWPALADRLAAEVLSGVSAGLGEYVSGSKTQPLHDHEAASLLLDEFAEWIWSWENTIRAGRGLREAATDPHRHPHATVAAACAFLPQHLTWLLCERPEDETWVAVDFGLLLLTYHRRAQLLTGTGQPDPVRVFGVACPNCDKCALEHEIEDGPTRKQRVEMFVYDENGDVKVEPGGVKATAVVTMSMEGAVTGYIACRRCKPTFRMTLVEYGRWTAQLAHDACTRGYATREKLAVVFGGNIPGVYLAAVDKRELQLAEEVGR